MSTTDLTIDRTTAVPAASTIRARPTGFVHDVVTIAGRALRAVPRDLEAVVPPVGCSIPCLGQSWLRSLSSAQLGQSAGPWFGC